MAGALVLALALGASDARAQVRVLATGVAGQVSSALSISGTREEGSGLWLGGLLRIEAGRLALEASGTRGKLTPKAGTQGFERDGGEMRGSLAVGITSWLAVEGGYAMRAFDSPAGYQKWTVPNVGLRVSTSLGTPGLRGYIRPSFLPSASIEGQSSAKTGLGVEAGFRLAPRSKPFTLGAFYRFERFDFDAVGTRFEHFDMLGVSAGIAIGR